MSEIPPPLPISPPPVARWVLVLARAVLVWEQLWPALWPATAAVLLFLVLALFDLPALLPGWLHLVLLLGFALVVLGGGIRAFRRLRRPDLTALLRRLEQDGGLAHRPLAALADRPVGEDPLSLALWAEHRRRAAEIARGAWLRVPKAGLLARDPYGLRVVLVLLLIIGLFAAGPDAPGRLGRALLPRFAPGGGGEAAASRSLDLWVTPPDYTHLPVLYRGLNRDPEAPAALAIPIGSQILAQYHGAGAARLRVGGAETAFSPMSDSDSTARAAIRTGDSIRVVVEGETLLDLPVTLIADQPPTATLPGPPHVTAHQALRIDYRATDDYGVAALALRLNRTDRPEAPPVDIPVALTASDPRHIVATTYQDLTANPWAGAPVELRLIATDALGQTGISAPQRLTLPARVFRSPAARLVVAQRRRLLQEFGIGDEVADALSELSVHPEAYGGDAGVFLGLRAAVAGLSLPHPSDGLPALLWDLAIKIEDGATPAAEREMRQAQEDLRQALANHADAAEIARRMQAFEAAMQNYLRNLAARPKPMGAQAKGPVRKVTAQDLKDMLDRARAAAEAGDSEGAANMLAQLQETLESLRVLPDGGANGQDAQGQAQEGAQTAAAHDLDALAGRQQQLLDRAFRAQQQAGGDEPDAAAGMIGGPGLAQAQEDLRRQLGALRRRLGGSGPADLARADEAMRAAGEALRRNDGAPALANLGQALARLRGAAEDLSKQAQDQASGSGEDDGTARDPFGRAVSPTPGGNDSVKLPDAAALQRSHQILEDLRNRAGDWRRPVIEREYLDRLLQRF